MFDTEKSLVEACRKGNRKAQQALYDRYKSQMLGVTSRYASSVAEAEDFMLEGFYKVFRDMNQFAERQKLQYWIRRIMINTCLMTLRKKGRIKFDQINGFDDLNSVYPNVLKQFDTEYILEQIQKLPTAYRIVFNLFAIEGFSHQEIATRLEIKESTSRSQYLRARHMLQAYLSKSIVYH